MADELYGIGEWKPGAYDPNTGYATTAPTYTGAQKPFLGTEMQILREGGKLRPGSGGFLHDIAHGNPLKAIEGVGRKLGDEWQNIVESDWGWAVPFAWAEKLGNQAGMWGPGGVLDQGQMPMMGAAAGLGAGLGTMNIFGGGGFDKQSSFENVLANLSGQKTRGQGNVSGVLNPQRQPYNLGGLGRLNV